MRISAAQSTVVASDHATRTQAAIQHPRLTAAAQQFEGMLLQELLKPMRERGFGVGQDEGSTDDSGGGGEILTSYGTEALATAIARSGGLGIAKHVMEQVEDERIAQNS